MAGRGFSSYEAEGFGYVPVAERRKQAEKEVAALRKRGRTITPVTLDGKTIARTFWGKAWCNALESYSDYANRLPRGRSYVRNGSVVHLGIASGTVEALVRGTTTYTVKLTVKPLAAGRWGAVVDDCSGEVTSLVELLEGKLSSGVMKIVTDAARGIFPSPREIALSCSCPDWATMCKHVAATMYGVGARLDRQPELLFLLRGVDPAQLIARSMGRAATKAARGRPPAIDEDALGSIFGIEIDAPATGDEGAKKKPLDSHAVALAAPKPRTAGRRDPRATTQRTTRARLVPGARSS